MNVSLVVGAGLVLVAATSRCTPFKDDSSLAIDAAHPDTGPACDPAKAFGSPAPVQGLTDIGAIAVTSVRLSPDSLTAYFAADGRSDSVGGYDLYVASRTGYGAPFGNVMPIPGARINSIYNDLDPSISGDGLTLVFGTSKLDSTMARLEYATKPLPTVPFTDRGPALDPTDAVAYNDSTPFLREDGQVLYFSSIRMPETGTDIYRAYQNTSAFGAPEPVNDINSSSSEVYPVVSPTDLTIYFASDRLGGQGDFDIWVATRDSLLDPFSGPRAVSELNSTTADFPSFVTSDGCTLYFTSARSGYLAPYFATKPAR